MTMPPYAELEPLIRQAELEGKWLHSAYHGLSFSPAELRKLNEEGSFRWGPANWTLCDPKEILAQARLAVETAIGQVHALEERMGLRRTHPEGWP